MKKLLFAILFTFLTSCSTVVGANRPAYLVGEPPNKVLNCAEALTLIDVRPEDVGPMKAYTREACRVAEAEKILLKTKEIKVIALPYDEVIANCSPPGGMALACTRMHPMRPGTYTIFIPHGSPGTMMHEVLHIILWEMGLPGQLHHPFMVKKGWYWIDRYKGADH